MNWQVDTFLAELRRRWPDTHETPGWRTRANRTAFVSGGPIGTMNHHTVTPASMSPASQISMIVNGFAGGTPGPIYNVIILTSGAVHLVAAGPANHAGQGRSDVRDRALRNQPPPGPNAPRGDNMNGNQTWFGIGLQHPGTNPDYPARQIDAMVAVNAAFLRARGFPAARAIHHRQWTARKIDLSWRGDLTARVAAALGAAPTPPTAPPPTAPPTVPPPRRFLPMLNDAEQRELLTLLRSLHGTFIPSGVAQGTATVGRSITATLDAARSADAAARAASASITALSDTLHANLIRPGVAQGQQNVGGTVVAALAQSQANFNAVNALRRDLAPAAAAAPSAGSGQ